MLKDNVLSANHNIIEIKDLTFKRDSKVIFEKASLNIPRGKVTAIMGPSGCGKTTLLRLIGGQIMPDEGTIDIEGQDITKISKSGLYKIRSRMGMLFQSGALFTDISVFENVAFPLREHTNLPESMIHDLVLMKLQAVGLRGAHSLMPSELSGGMARRVALARAIALDPDFIMYDEPFTGQDPISLGVLVQLIRLLNDALDMTSILVSHDIHETISIADQIFLISNGQVVGAGSPDDLINSDDEWVRQFMQALPDGPVPFHYPAQTYAEDLWGADRC
ncbi:MAG TPA: ATP-binding cassette domain-containing protein [Gammaproteobacteria bacterium]|nr:ATP-binding cassette domain-containing protein [Gammaproteobacteria bacterium]